MNMHLRLGRRVAAVTGGMGGIGGGIVVALTKREFDVVACDRTIDQGNAEYLVARAAPGARMCLARCIRPEGLRKLKSPGFTHTALPR